MATILIAGTNGANVDNLAAVIEGEGHQTLIGRDGKEAYDLTLAESPDLIILEASLPIFDGFETCQMIRSDPENPADLPIILVAENDVDPKKVERAGFSEVVDGSRATLRVRELLIEHLGPKAVPDRRP